MNKEQFGKLMADVEWIRENLEKKADKWVEKPLVFVMVGVAGWVLTQVLGLIEVAKALL